MNCVSLFSGCGGLDLGLQEAGFDIRFATDNSPICESSHSANFPGSIFFAGDVSELSAELIYDKTGLKAGEVDLLAGGPPCQPFSKSRFYRSDKPRALSDPLGQQTFAGYIGMMEALRPRIFLLENVPGLAYKVHKDAFDLLLESAVRLGYKCRWGVVDAADYGVPQHRQRFFMIGSQERLIDFPAPSHRDPKSNGLFSNQTREWISTRIAIGDLDTEANADDASHFAGGRHHHLLKEIPPGENYLYFTEKRGHPNPEFEWRSRYWSFLLKLDPDRPSWTIQARRSNNMGPFHWRNRILRIPEVKRLQSFPDNWQLAGTVEQQWRQVGNAVPPLLGKALGAAIMKALRGSTAGIREECRI